MPSTSQNEFGTLLDCQRHLFDIPNDVAYLNCAYISPLLNAVRDAGIAGTQRKVILGKSFRAISLLMLRKPAVCLLS